MKRKHALKNQIRSRKRVGIADGAQADVFSRPCPDPFRIEQRFAQSGGALMIAKRKSALQYAPAEIANRRAPHSRGLDHVELGFGENQRRRKQVCLFSGKMINDLFTIILDELAIRVARYPADTNC